MSPTLTIRDESGSCSRMCSDCGEALSIKRLNAHPRAEQCVPCLEQRGDVPTIKRFDEFTPQGEIVSTLFTRNKAIERQMHRVNTEAAPEAAYDIAIGDDSHLIRAGSKSNNVHAYSMSEAFETDEEEVKALLQQCEDLIATEGFVEVPLAQAATA